VDRGIILSNIENVLGYIKQMRESSISNQDSLFAGTEIAFDGIETKLLIKKSR
jgi:hypothetical protein